MSTSTVLRDLQPDTKYTVTLVPGYTEAEGKRSSANGKTSKRTHACLEATVHHVSSELLMVSFDP